MNRSRLRWLYSLVLFALTTGCDEATAPAGTPSTVAVRAYVDVDGSGTFTAGDTPIAGAPVTLAETTGSGSLQATTDAGGVATFTSVPPGRYQVRMTAAAPGGAILATAAEPVITAPYRGGSVDAEFRFVFNPGEIRGRLFRDNNDNGVYDQGVDTPAPGIPVQLFASADGSGDVIAETTTDVDGEYAFTALRTGVYSVLFTPLPTMELPGGVLVQAQVDPAATRRLDVEFTGNLISTIAEARAQGAGAVAAVEGVVTVSQGLLNARQIYVQDHTGGIWVFLPTGVTGLVAGDMVRLVGPLSVFSGELQFNQPTAEKIGTAEVPAPRPVTVAQVAAGEFMGELLRLDNVEVVAVSGSATSTAYNVTVQDGETQAVVRIAAATVGIPQTFWEIGRRYTITGVLGQFNAVPQLKVRSPDDVVAGSTALPIAKARLRPANDTVMVEGVVTVSPGPLGATTVYVQDASGGIMVFNMPASAGVVEGDSIRLTARISAFGGEPQLAPIQVQKLGTGTVPAPRTVSGTDFTARIAEGELVRAAGVEVVSVGNASGSGAYTVVGRVADGTRVDIRIASGSVGIPREYWTVGERYDVVGLLGSFNGTPQIKPRRPSDVSEGTALNSVAQAKTMAGDTVLVEGVVTVAPGTLNVAGTNMYIQDASGGVLVFNVPADLGIEVGDVVRVYGLMGMFSGEFQIARFSSTSPPVITIVGTAPVPQPRTITAAELVARTYEGQLARIENVEVVSIGTVSGTTGGYNVTVRAPDDTQFVVRIDSRNVGIPVEFFEAGARYDVTGVLSAFNNVAQIKPRSQADVVRR